MCAWYVQHLKSQNPHSLAPNTPWPPSLLVHAAVMQRCLRLLRHRIGCGCQRDPSAAPRQPLEQLLSSLAEEGCPCNCYTCSACTPSGNIQQIRQQHQPALSIGANAPSTAATSPPAHAVWLPAHPRLPTPWQRTAQVTTHAASQHGSHHWGERSSSPSRALSTAAHQPLGTSADSSPGTSSADDLGWESLRSQEKQRSQDEQGLLDESDPLQAWDPLAPLSDPCPEDWTEGQGPWEGVTSASSGLGPSSNTHGAHEHAVGGDIHPLTEQLEQLCQEHFQCPLPAHIHRRLQKFADKSDPQAVSAKVQHTHEVLEWLATDAGSRRGQQVLDKLDPVGSAPVSELEQRVQVLQRTLSLESRVDVWRVLAREPRLLTSPQSALENTLAALQDTMQLSRAEAVTAVVSAPLLSNLSRRNLQSTVAAYADASGVTTADVLSALRKRPSGLTAGIQHLRQVKVLMEHLFALRPAWKAHVLEMDATERVLVARTPLHKFSRLLFVASLGLPDSSLPAWPKLLSCSRSRFKDKLCECESIAANPELKAAVLAFDESSYVEANRSLPTARPDPRPGKGNTGAGQQSGVVVTGAPSPTGGVGATRSGTGILVGTPLSLQPPVVGAHTGQLQEMPEEQQRDQHKGGKERKAEQGVGCQMEQMVMRRLMRMHQLGLARASSLPMATVRQHTAAVGRDEETPRAAIPSHDRLSDSKERPRLKTVKRAQRVAAAAGPYADVSAVLRQARQAMQREQAIFRAKAHVVDDVLRRHPPWRKLASELPAAERLRAVEAPLTNLARLRFLQDAGVADEATFWLPRFLHGHLPAGGKGLNLPLESRSKAWRSMVSVPLERLLEQRSAVLQACAAWKSGKEALHLYYPQLVQNWGV